MPPKKDQTAFSFTRLSTFIDNCGSLFYALAHNSHALSFAFTSGFARADTKTEKGSAVFYGVVQAVDLGNKTFTIQAEGRSYVFHYNEQTKISSAQGYIRWDTVQAGQGRRS